MRKGLIFATTLAMALGVGVAVSAHQGKAATVKADGESSTMYCKMTYDWWTVDEAAIAVHYWGGASGTSYPGTRGESVETNVWKFSIPNDSTGFMFVRVNGGTGAVSDWGAKTKDLSFTAAGENNLFTITNSTPVWGDPGCQGDWSAYEEPVDPPTPPAQDVPEEAGYYIVGTKSDWKFAGATKMDAGEDGNYAQLIGYSASEGEEFKVRGYGIEGAKDWYGWTDDGNYVVSEDTTLDIYINDQNNLWVQEHQQPEPPTPTDVPDEDGYYLVGTESNWKYAGATKMSAGSEGNKAELIGYEAKAGEIFKVRSYLETVDTWYGENYEVGENARTLDIYLNNAGEVYVFDHQGPITPDIPDEDGYYLVGTESNWKYSGATKLSAGEDSNLAQLIGYSAKANEEFQVRSYIEKVDTWYGVGESWDQNYKVGEEAKVLDIYLNAEGHLYVFEHQEPVDPDVPAEDGYYLISSKTEWKYEGSTKMTQVDPALTGNVAVLYDYKPAKSEGIKVRSYFSGEDKYSANSDPDKDYGKQDEFHNFVFADDLEEDASFDIYAYYDGDSFLFSVTPHIERAKVTIVAKQYAGAQYKGETSALKVDETAIGEPYTLPAVTLPEGYVAVGVYSDFECTVPFVSGETVVESDIMLHIKVQQLGYYLAGGADQTFSIDTATKLSGDAQNKIVGTVIVPAGTTAENPYKVKPLEFVADAGEGKPGWSDISYTMGHEEEPSFVHFDADGNFVFTASGTYAFYVNNENKVWFNGGEYAFHERFLAETAAQCDAQGKSTNIEALQAAWVELETAFKGLSEEEIAAIREVGFNGGDEHSTDARLRMVARYSYIVSKYGTSVFKDFIWGQEYQAASAVSGISTLDNTDNSTMIIVIAIAATSALAFGALLLIKKRKHN